MHLDPLEAFKDAVESDMIDRAETLHEVNHTTKTPMNQKTISLKGLDKGAVLAALYNNSRPLGMGFMHFTPETMTPDQGGELLKQTTYFDYLKGRVMKVDLSGDSLDPWLYDRDNGDGAAQRAISSLPVSVTE
jgi:hypothetical protein